MGDTNLEFAPESMLDDHMTRKEVTVLVTGYGPFLDQIPVNPSWSVASTLPDSLPATPTSPRIRILKHTEPIKVAYHAVTSVVPKLLSTTDENRPDIILHIGLAARRPFYTLERQAPRTPYWVGRDVDGQTFSLSETENLWPATTFPQLLKPTLDIEDVYTRWRSNIKNLATDIRTSSDPGNFLCGFIYYLSMSWFWRQEREERPVMFLHVPHLVGEEKIEEGRGVAVGLIRALVESREELGVRDPLKGDERNDQPMGAAEMEIKRQKGYAGWDGVS